MSEIKINTHKSRIALDRWLKTRQSHLLESKDGLKKVFTLVKDQNGAERFVFIQYRETDLGFKVTDIQWMVHPYSSLVLQENWHRNYNFKFNSGVFTPGKFKKVDKEFVKYFKNTVSTLELPAELLNNSVIFYRPKGVILWNDALQALVYPNNFNYNNSSNSLLSS